MKKPKKQLCMIFFIMIFTLMLSGCAKEERQMGIDGYIYVPDTSPLPLPGNYFYEKLAAKDGYLYYQMGGFGVGRLWLGEEAENSVNFFQIKISSGSSLLSFAVDEELAVYYLQAKVKYSSDSMETSDVCLIKQLPDGSQAYKVALEDFRAGQDDVALEVNQEKQAFVLAGMDLYGVDADGSCVKEMVFEGNKAPSNTWLLEGEGGSVYLLEQNTVYSLYKLTLEKSQVHLERADVANWPDNLCRFYSSPYGLLCDTPRNILYQYQAEDASWHALLRWGDSDEIGSIGSIAQISEDKIAAFSSFDDVARLFRRTAVSELPEKKILVMASTRVLDYNLAQAIREFNQTSTDCRIVVEPYGWSQEELTKLDIRLLSSDPPDLLIMDDMDIVKYAEKGMLEDLVPYLESSSLVKYEDFLGSVLAGYTISDRLAAIPAYVQLRTLLGRAEEVGTAGNWTAEDMMELADKHPQYHLMRMNSLEFVYPFFADYVYRKYIDWENGACSFDSDSFREFIKWMERHTEEIETDYEKIYPADEVLFYDTWMYNEKAFLQVNYTMGCEAAIMGYPSEKGELYFPVKPGDILAITSKSPYKEEAWQFLESFLSGIKELEREHLFFHGFTTSLSALDRQLEDGLADGNEKIVSVDGEWEPEWVKWSGASEEEMARLKQYIEDADYTPQGGVRDAVSDIVMEEIAVYLNGEKPLEEVSRIIQNRVINLVQENM